ncbi:hypothetical protein, partial [aff. Roholtiella sp. LEGE 12411]|uniref:hypothetical protein n=1 Tax=aff. Roholtiella sp. LEGE 12411 TaxID=1828822 RepID=UPI001ABC365F
MPNTSNLQDNQYNLSSTSNTYYYWTNTFTFIDKFSKPLSTADWGKKSRVKGQESRVKSQGSRVKSQGLLSLIILSP